MDVSMKIGGKKIRDLLARLKGQPQPEHSPERRQCARLIYPPNHRPRFCIRQQDMEVIDISETGLRLFLDDADVGQRVHGTVRFGSGSQLNVTGEIVWQHGREVGLLISQNPPCIPESLIYEEIRWVLRETGLSQPPEDFAPPVD